ncbi:MAG: response regulator transcription factor [Planctomycetota bacterium]
MNVLIVEDEAGISDFLRAGLTESGFSATVASNGALAVSLAQNESFAAYILDIMLPDMDGIELCRQFRDDGITAPILMLTAKAALTDKVNALSAGADDYLTKPFEYDELLARLRALIRKTQGYPRSTIRIADLSVDPNTKTVMRGEVGIELSKKEYQLMEYLARHHDRLVTREMISKSVWDCETNTYSNIIDVFINFLRKKIDTGSDTKLIHTIRGKGFVLSDTAPGAKS